MSKRSFPNFATQTNLCSLPSGNLSKVSEDSRAGQQASEKQEVPIRIVLPFKDQKSAKSARRQPGDLSRKISEDVSPVYTSRKIKDEIKVKEDKPPLVNQQSVVYHFQRDLCIQVMSTTHADTYINGLKSSRDWQHDMDPEDIMRSFKILRECQNKLDCLIFEMLFIKELKPTPLVEILYMILQDFLGSYRIL